MIRILALTLVLGSLWPTAGANWFSSRLNLLPAAKLDSDLSLSLTRARIRSMFTHAYDGYMKHAFPADELRPISGLGADTLGSLGDHANTEHPTYSGVALTLIDALSALAIFNNASEFKRATQLVAAVADFDQDVRVNVFETNIRVLGGLLSAHLLALDSPVAYDEYDGALLRLAQDLGYRLLPAFQQSPTCMPYPWVNLRSGVLPNETTHTNLAAVGSLLLELGVLGRLTGDCRFERVAAEAIDCVMLMRQPNGLLGKNLDMESMTWLDVSGGIGSGADSFYEIVLKAHLLLDSAQSRNRYWALFSEIYPAALRGFRAGASGWYHDANIVNGAPLYLQFNALMAFWPGLQVLAGDVPLAAATFDRFFSLWERFSALPENFHWKGNTIHPTDAGYHGRPELIESAYYLYQATGDLKYLEAGKRIMEDLERFCRTPFGYATLASAERKEHEDTMPSYFLSETLPYLYLLFDPTNYFAERSANAIIFSTEAHPFPADLIASLGPCGSQPPPSKRGLWGDPAANRTRAHATATTSGPAASTADPPPSMHLDGTTGGGANVPLVALEDGIPSRRAAMGASTEPDSADASGLAAGASRRPHIESGECAAATSHESEDASDAEAVQRRKTSAVFVPDIVVEVQVTEGMVGRAKHRRLLARYLEGARVVEEEEEEEDAPWDEEVDAEDVKDEDEGDLEDGFSGRGPRRREEPEMCGAQGDDTEGEEGEAEGEEPASHRANQPKILQRTPGQLTMNGMGRLSAVLIVRLDPRTLQDGLGWGNRSIPVRSAPVPDGSLEAAAATPAAASPSSIDYQLADGRIARFQIEGLARLLAEVDSREIIAPVLDQIETILTSLEPFLRHLQEMAGPAASFVEEGELGDDEFSGQGALGSEATARRDIDADADEADASSSAEDNAGAPRDRGTDDDPPVEVPRDERRRMRALGSMLQQRRCLSAGMPRAAGVQSLCHLPDLHAAHRCRSHADCGVSAATCKGRRCSVFGFCADA